MDPAIDFLSNDERRWDILRSYLMTYGTIGPQISSYEHFCTTLLPEIIQEQSTIFIECEAKNRCDTVSFAAPNGGWGATICRPQYISKDGKEVDLLPTRAVLTRGWS